MSRVLQRSYEISAQSGNGQTDSNVAGSASNAFAFPGADGVPLMQGGPSMQQSPSPLQFPTQHQNANLYAPGPSNPPTSSAFAQIPPQVTSAPLTASGTQFYMTPLGLGTIPPAAFQGTIFARQQMNPQPQAHQMNSNPYESAALTPEQFHAMSQSLARRASTTADLNGSPMSDNSTLSLHTAPTAHSNIGSPDPSAMRRMSMPNVVPSSPLRPPGYSSPGAPQLQVEASSHPRQARLNANSYSLSTAGRNLSSRSPRMNPGTQSSVSENQVFPNSTQHAGNSIPTVQSPFLDPDQYFFDFSLPRHEQDLYYDPTTNTQHHPSLMFGPSTGQHNNAGIWDNVPSPSPANIPSPLPQNLAGGGDQVYNFSETEFNGRRTVGTDFSKHSEQNVDKLWEEYQNNHIGQQQNRP
ncbi:hypothetical protein TWF694_009113 [Orbilia ellipsospora]